MQEQMNKQLGQLRQTAVELGLGPALKLVRRTVLPSARRNAIDDHHLALLLSFVLQEDSNCIDVGAHRGDVLKSIVLHAPRGEHIAYEPLPHLFEYLCLEFPTVTLKQAALAEKAGVSPFAYVRSRPAYSGLRQRTPDGAEDVEQIEVVVEVLDETLPPEHRIDLIKIDVEGAEYGVLKGGQKLLATNRPYVIFEFGAAARKYGTSAEDMYRLIDGDLGLRIFDMDGTGPYTLGTFRRTFDNGNRFNFVAHA
ncbi:FkbM family methyltransferase [Parafrankia sp. FMc2]|uniref:FkbM family methyltransferase n=1 Tax=Parafrankia sp. FMc2 TaxID=3233196 RepID=UPI0034D687E4